MLIFCLAWNAKNLDVRCVLFYLNFLNAQDFLAQEIYDMQANFCQFSDLKNGG